MDSKKRFVTNMVAQILSFVINLGINFFLSKYVVEVIGQEVYGFVGLANNFTSYVQVFTVAFNAMLNRYVTVKMAQNKYKEARRYFSTITICNLVISCALFIPSVLLCCFLEYVIEVPAVYASDVKLLWLFIFVAFLVTLATNTFQTCFFATNRLDLSAKRSLENYLLRAVLLCGLFAVFSPHIWYVGLASLICAVFLAALNMYYKKKLTPQLKVHKSDFSFSIVKELFGIGIWNSVNQLSQLLLTGFDLLVTNLFIGSAEMGLLSIAKVIPTQLLAFVGMVSNVFAPRMTIAYAKDDGNGFLEETKFSMKICGLLCSVPIIGFIVFGQSFIRLWMTSLSDEEVFQVQILSVLTLLPTLLSIYVYPLYNVNTITCKLKIPVLVSVGIGISSLGIVYVLLSTTNLGVYAVAGVSSVLLMFRVLLFVPMYAAHNLKMKLLTFYPTLIRGIVSGMVVYGSFSLIANLFAIDSWLKLFGIVVIAGTFGYICVFALIFSKKERKEMIYIIKKGMIKKHKL